MLSSGTWSVLASGTLNDVTNEMSFLDRVARTLKLPKTKSKAHQQQKSGTPWQAFLLLSSPLDPPRLANLIAYLIFMTYLHLVYHEIIYALLHHLSSF